MKTSPTTEVAVLGGRYRLDHLLGRGGAGSVWAGHDTVLDRPVAVKMLRDDLGTEEPLQRERLLAEARSVAAVRHRNLVTAFDAGADEGIFAIVMERLPGPSLADRLHDGPLSADEVRAVGSDVLAGLAALHEAGFVHRDVKPGNVLRAADGRWTLVDFGVAKDLHGGPDLTVTGNTVGTPSYIAPEQLFGAGATPMADLWAVGVMLYRAISGHLPFDGTTPYAIAYAAYTASRKPLAELVPDVDPDIARTVERALHKSLDHRFESAEAMAASLADPSASATPPALVQAPPPGTDGDRDGIARRRRSPVAQLALAASIVLAVTAAAGLAIGGRGDDPDPSPATAEPSGDDTGPPSSAGPPATGGSPFARADEGADPATGRRSPFAAGSPSGDPAGTYGSTTDQSTTTPLGPNVLDTDPSLINPPGTDGPVLNPPGTTPPTTDAPVTTLPTTDPPATDPDKPKPPRPSPSSTVPPGRP